MHEHAGQKPHDVQTQSGRVGRYTMVTEGVPINNTHSLSGITRAFASAVNWAADCSCVNISVPDGSTLKPVRWSMLAAAPLE